jgi:chromosome segregation ATPase
VEDKKDSGIRRFIDRLIFWDSPDAAVGSEDADHPDTPEEERTPPKEGVLPLARTVSERIAAMKNALELSHTDTKSRINRINSAHSLLLFSYEVLLSKFASLKGIGFLGADSSLVLDQLYAKYESILSKSQGDDMSRLQKLKTENHSLREEVKRLKAKYIKTGIISDRELELEDEIKHMNRRVRELKTQLQIAHRKYKALHQNAEMVPSLMAKNSLLNMKIENQARLIESLLSKDPKSEDLVEVIHEVRLENRNLKNQIERQNEWFVHLSQHVAPDTPFREQLESLFSKNARLKSELHERESQFEGLMETAPQVSLSDTVENLNNESFRLKTLLETKQAITDYMADKSEGRDDPERIVEILKAENQRLQEVLDAKCGQIKVLTNNPSNRMMVKAVMRLRKEKAELFKANESKDYLCRELERERALLQVKAGKVEALRKVNRQLKAKIETDTERMKIFQNLEHKYMSLKKEYSETISKLNRSQSEIRDLKEKLSKTMTEYKILVKEYENLFGQLTR